MFNYLGSIVEDLVPHEVVVSRNKTKGWEYGYDADYDLIIISKDGTLGKIFSVNGLNIGLPKTPPKKEILFHDKKKSDQRWSVTPMPKGINYSNYWHEEHKDYVNEEIKRRKNGVWIYLNGAPFYLTGLAYYFYQWIKLDVGAPRFRVIQNELMLYWEACKADPNCYGICYVKNRRFGWSSIGVSELLYTGTSVKDKELGLVSKTGADGKKMFTRLVRAFKKLPPFFQPLWDGTSSPKTELLLEAPASKVAKGNRGASGAESLETVIRYHNTTINAMDGDTIYRSVIDEAGKFTTKVPFDEYWNIVNTSHEVGGVIKGRAMVGSTVNEMSKGGKAFKDVYFASNPSERSTIGRTSSGLYGLFISAEFCLEDYIDSYGFAIVDDCPEGVVNENGLIKKIGSNTYLDSVLVGLEKNPSAYNEQLRKFPRNEEDAFRDSADDCAFNVLNLTDQIKFNEENITEGYELGNLVWQDGIKDTIVKWIPDPNGRFKIAHHPPEEVRNKKEMKTIRGVKAYAPTAEHLGAFGVDPYNRDQTADNKGSLGSIHLKTKMNTSWLPNNAFILEYIYRPLKVLDFFEDVIKAFVYYSMPVLCELSNDALLNLIKDRGYRHFSMNNPYKNYSDLNPTEKQLGGAPHQNQTIGLEQFYAVESYVQEYVGYAIDATNRPIGEIGYMPFNETLEQWKKVDVQKRTKWDAYISSSLAIIANQRLPVAANKKSKKIKLQLRRYTNTGQISRRL